MANIHIANATGTVKAIDGESLLTPQALDQIVQAVLLAVDERQLRDKRSKSDTSVTAGVAAEQETA
jgi:hypothetical protein